MKTFIRVVEVWVPDAEYTLLEFGSGYYGTTRGFGANSRDLCFGRGEGLPGQAWEQRRPLVLKQLDGSVFRRTRAAAAENLSCAIALPMFTRDRLRAVLLILCGDDDEHVGAIELWRCATDSSDMKLDDGYYGGTADVFEFLSHHTSFRKGTGLPGLVWESGLPVFLPDLGKGGKFLRADSAERVGINRGFALPCPVPGPDTFVMAFLSARATPLVRRFEIWLPDAEGARLHRAQGFCEVEGELDGKLETTGAGRSDGLIGRVFVSATPEVTQQPGDEPGAVGAAARGAGLRAMLALPVMQGERVAAIVAWYF